MIEDVSADLVTDKTHLLIQPRAIVGLSHWLLRTYAQANRNDKVLAVVTRPDSVLTLAAARFINDARACWIVDHPDGAYDGFSGLRAHWDGLSFTYDGELHPAYLEVAVDDDRSISISAETTHGDNDDPQLGHFSLQVLAAAGCAPPTRFGVVEPLCEPFSPTLVTEHARALSPKDSISIVSGGDGDGLIISVPQPVGVVERLEFSGPRDKDLTPALISHFFHHCLDAGATYASLGYRLGPQGRMVTPRYLHEVMPVALAVPETALPHTTLESLMRTLHEHEVGEVNVLDSTPRGIEVRFSHENTTIIDLIGKQKIVLRSILPPDVVENIKPWYQQDT